MRNVYVAGMGVVSAIGDNYTFWQNLAHRKSGLSKVEIRLPGSNCLVDLPYGRPRSEEADELFRRSCVNVDPERVRGLATKYAIAAVRQALSKDNHFWGASYEVRDLRLQDAWLFVGTSSANLHLVGQGLAGNGKVPDSPQGLPATFVAMNEGIGGRRLTISTACCSSTDAIGLAYEAVRDGNCETAIAVGTEGDYMDERLTAALQYEVQSKSGVCRPFDRRRDGSIFAEGAGALVLTVDPAYRHEKLRCVNYFSLKRASHPTHADHSAIADCMCAARNKKVELRDEHHRKLGRSDEIFETVLTYWREGLDEGVRIISPHAGGTVQGDEAMAKAIKFTFSANPEIYPPPWCYNSRPLHGHAVGASGIIETVGMLMCMRHRLVPPSPIEDSEFPWIRSPREVERLPEHCYGMKVSVGMGGSYACLLFEKTE